MDSLTARAWIVAVALPVLGTLSSSIKTVVPRLSGNAKSTVNVTVEADPSAATNLETSSTSIGRITRLPEVLSEDDGSERFDEATQSKISFSPEIDLDISTNASLQRLPDIETEFQVATIMRLADVEMNTLDFLPTAAVPEARFYAGVEPDDSIETSAESIVPHESDVEKQSTLASEILPADPQMTLDAVTEDFHDQKSVLYRTFDSSPKVAQAEESERQRHFVDDVSGSKDQPEAPPIDSPANTDTEGDQVSEVSVAVEPRLATLARPSFSVGREGTRYHEPQTGNSLLRSDLPTPDDAVHVPPTTTAHKFPQETEVVKSPSGWSPVDLRTVDVSTQGAIPSRPAITKATPADELQARNAVQLGFELIQRRAPYSARARFIEALRIVARSLDDQAYLTTHVTALRHALTAYEEASDFFPSSNRPDEEVNLHAIVGGHDTPILQKADPHVLSPRQCLREYLAYAEQEFAAALGKDEIASQALYGLARLESATETTASTVEQVRAHRSMTLHQSCLIVNSNNFAAANELGVLLGRYGKYEQAVDALTHCVRLSPQPTAWKNLANIHRQLGQPEQARMAEHEAQRALASSPGTPFVASQPTVEWVDVDTFASIASRDPNVQAAQQRTPITERVPVKTASKKRLWLFGRDKAPN